MRPAGEIRQALARAAESLVNEGNAVTWRDLAERAGVGYLAARRTVENMARTGALRCVGYQKRPHSRRWMTVYEPGSNWATQSTGSDLAGVIAHWGRGG